MYPKFCYIKKYKISPTGSSILLNPQLANDYIAEKRDALSFAKNEENLLKVKLNILRDFEQIYEYDKLYSQLPEPFGTFNSEEDKRVFLERHLLINDFHLYLGNICLNYHEDLLDMKHYFPLMRNFENITDYESLYNNVIEDYARALKNAPAPPFLILPKSHNIPKNIKFVIQEGKIISKDYSYQNSLNSVRSLPHAYSATFILPALIENSLISNIDIVIQFLFYKSIQNLKNGGKNISIEEERLCMAFEEAIKFNNIVMENIPKEQIYENMWNIGCKRGFFNEKQKELHSIFLHKLGKNKPITLGWLLNSEYIKEIIRPEYLTLMLNLFGTKRINIRNSIMHGYSANFNYLSIGFAAVMLQLFWDIIDRNVFKEKIKI
ncbi:hypothetical protein [Candidatus Ruminimicrobium bovinum]|uniref:hypothetical protein n=1 Tax=Candidatus Ruminimicrobium bovinum TaxID=3242779 RepID=UPI0039B82B14